MEKLFNLNGILVIAQEHDKFPDQFVYTWSELTGPIRSWDDQLRKKVHVDIRHDITYLTGWKSDSLKKRLGDLEKVAAYLTCLEPWRKTRYWIKLDDSGTGEIHDCMTGKKAEQKNLLVFD